MNIFVLAKSPREAARMHCDKHCIKMILESAQLLSTAHHVLDGKTRALKRLGKRVPKPTHRNHPCAQWARQTNTNYMWLHTLMCELCREYTKRYGRTHKYQRYVLLALLHVPLNIPSGPRTPFAQCMPPQYKSVSAVSAYRRYYRGEKRRFATWRLPRMIPTWFNKGE